MDLKIVEGDLLEQDVEVGRYRRRHRAVPDVDPKTGEEITEDDPEVTEDDAPD